MRRGDHPADTVAGLVHALRAEVEAYRAEVAANRAETATVIRTLLDILAKMQADMAAVMRRIYDVTSEESTERWRSLARDILSDDPAALRRRLDVVPDFEPVSKDPVSKDTAESPVSEWSPMESEDK